MPESGEPASAGEIPAETVRKVAEKVYALLLQDLKRERERRRARPAKKWKK